MFGIGYWVTWGPEIETRSLENNDGVKTELGVNVKKMMISNETTGKVTEKSKSLCAVCRKVQRVIPFSASFSTVRCKRDVVVSDVNLTRIKNTNVKHEENRKQT